MSPVLRKNLHLLGLFGLLILVAILPVLIPASPVSSQPSKSEPVSSHPLVAVPTLSSTPAGCYSATTNPPPTKAGWRLVLDESFDSTCLNTQVWNSQYRWGNTNPPELERYLPGALNLESGHLQLQANPSPSGKYPYTSGMIASFDRFYIQYGYVEMRAKVPKGQGLWPAFWLLAQNSNSDNEIDVMEIIGKETNNVHVSLHYQAPDGNTGIIESNAYGPDFSQDYHTYAIQWDWDQVIWFVDGREVFRTTDHVPHEPMYLIANLAVGGNWPGAPDSTTVFPASYDIDYIHVFTH